MSTIAQVNGIANLGNGITNEKYRELKNLQIDETITQLARN